MSKHTPEQEVISSYREELHRHMEINAELLEALQLLLSLVRMYPIHKAPANQFAINQVEAAIQKATGGQK